MQDHQSTKEHRQVYLFREKKFIHRAKFVQNSAVTLHATGYQCRASLHQSEGWIFARENFRTVEKLVFSYTVVFGFNLNCYKSKLVISLGYQSY